MAQKELIQIDLQKVISAKLGKKSKYVPRAFVEWLKRTVCQDELNEKLRKFYPKQDVEFCNAVMEDFNISVDVVNPGKMPDAEHKRIIIVSNHPLGGMDGVLLIAELSRLYGPKVKFIVNDILMAIDPLQGVFLPINKHGKQSRESINAINEAMEGDDPIVIFPAGLVSRRGPKGEIRDLEWHKMFVAKAVQYHRDVLPIFFSGRNSSFFYKFAQWRKRLGIKFNIEMIYLPSEALKCTNKKFTIAAGDLIPWEQLRDGGDYLQQAQRIKETLYTTLQYQKP